MEFNFSWVVPGKVAGSARPGRMGRDITADLNFLYNQGIRAIINLTVEFQYEVDLDKRFHYLHVPVYGFTAPKHEQIVQALAFIEAQNANGRPVLVHCAEGVGRAGTLLACYLVAQGQTATEAITNLRKVRPNSIETASQLQAVYDYAQALAQENI